MLIILYYIRYLVVCLFFFSSRRRHTRLVSDWSSDVCSSDLGRVDAVWYGSDKNVDPSGNSGQKWNVFMSQVVFPTDPSGGRSEERRVGKECSAGGGGYC